MGDGGNGPSAGSGLRGRDLIGIGGLLVGAVGFWARIRAALRE
jgi:hypothetical protein